MKTVIKSGALVAAIGLALAGCGSGGPNTTEVNVPSSNNAGPGGGRYVVAMGDSYISGEGGRNVNNGTLVNGKQTPGYKVGSFGVAYGNGQGKEEIDGCHRSHTAMIYVKDGWNGENLACSGATTESFIASNGQYKPGLFGSPKGKQSQSQMLEAFAKQNDVGAIVVSIGGNDLGFSSIVSSCVESFVLQSGNLCQNGSTVAKEFSSSNKAKVAKNVAKGFKAIQTAMFNAGYKDKDWQLVYNLYPQPLAAGDQVSKAYPETTEGRITKGHCPFYNSDMTWANTTLLPTLDDVIKDGFNQFLQDGKQGKYTVTILDNTKVLDGHKLCQDTADRLKTDMTGVSQTPNFDSTGLHAEWVNDIVLNQQARGKVGQQAVHPNYWGQRALTSCVRMTVNNGGEYSGKQIACEPDGTGLNEFGDPKMKIGSVNGI